MARVREAARRVEFYSGKTDTATLFENGGLCIHYDSMEVTVKGEIIHLTPIEYRILKLLAQNTGRVLTHSMIIRDVWGSLDQNRHNAGCISDQVMNVPLLCGRDRSFAEGLSE